MKALLRTSNLAIRDLSRFLDRHYLTAKAADLLHRSLRRRMSQAVLAAGAGFLGARLSTVTTGGAGPTAALAFGFGLLAWCLQLWATRILSARLAYARSHGSFLLKDRKKTALLNDLPRLWRRVFAPEISLVFPDPEERRQLRANLLELERTAQGSSFESRRFDFGYRLSHSRLSYGLLSARAFRAATQYELSTSHPQNAQDGRLGFSLALLEDALDTTVFGHNEESSFERQAAHASMQAAKELLASRQTFTARWRMLIENACRKQFQTFWRRNVALALEARAGALLHRLHRRYRTSRIDVQDLLWQDEESLLALTLAVAEDSNGQTEETLPPPIADILSTEATLAARQVFSPYEETIQRIVQRMHGYDLVQATLLLAATDPDYALAFGSGISPASPLQGSCDPMLDLEAAGASTRDHQCLKRLAEDAAGAEATWPKALNEAFGSPEAFTKALPEPASLRAVRLAWHADEQGLRRHTLDGTLESTRLEELVEELAQKSAAATERLRTLRLSRELAAWHLGYTLDYAHTLCGFEKDSKPESPPDTRQNIT